METTINGKRLVLADTIPAPKTWAWLGVFRDIVPGTPIVNGIQFEVAVDLLVTMVEEWEGVEDPNDPDTYDEQEPTWVLDQFLPAVTVTYNHVVGLTNAEGPESKN